MSNVSRTMMDIHAEALSGKLSAYHEFLSRYHRRSRVVYGFVEGKTDPSFYQGFIEQLLPNEWQCELWAAGNRDNVYRIHKDMDWRRFTKRRVCFFVDRDLSDLIPENLKADRNIYITDGYSIENDVVKRGTCRRLLSEVFGFSTATHGELDQLCDLFDEELESFFVAMVPIMTWILLWRQTNQRANLNDIAMRHLFKIKAGRVIAEAAPCGMKSVAEYIHAKSGAAFQVGANTASHQAKVGKASVYRRFTRGKYVLWFMVEFCQSVYAAACALCPSLSLVPKINISVSERNAVTVIGNRARMPDSLRAFLTSTFCAYVNKHLN